MDRRKEGRKGEGKESMNYKWVKCKRKLKVGGKAICLSKPIFSKNYAGDGASCFSGMSKALSTTLKGKISPNMVS